MRRNGVGCLNSHRTTFVHWFRRRGKSLRGGIHHRHMLSDRKRARKRGWETRKAPKTAITQHSGSKTHRWLRIHFAYAGYMMVSDVGRMATGSGSADWPDWVTHATSGANPSTWSASASSAFLVTKTGKYAFSTPRSLISLSKKPWMVSQMLQRGAQTA